MQAASDTRTIYTLMPGLPTSLSGGPNLTTAERAYFTGKGVLLHQYQTRALPSKGLLTMARSWCGICADRQATDVRRTDGSFRDRDHVLGDTVSASPPMSKAPFNFADSGYASFKSSNVLEDKPCCISPLTMACCTPSMRTQGRLGRLFPRMVMQNMYKLAADDYEARHAFFVDGSPEVMDVQIGGTQKTLLVGGLNKGGRGYYAPISPIQPTPRRCCGNSAQTQRFAAATMTLTLRVTIYGKPGYYQECCWQLGGVDCIRLQQR